MVTVVRGDVILCDLNPVVGTEQAGVRPALVVQIDRANTVSPHYCAIYDAYSARSVASACADSGRYRRLTPRVRGPLRADSGHR
jgi:mRNA-degrading endonuclease toxin of MazEF toxin-antitoxin module